MTLKLTLLSALLATSSLAMPPATTKRGLAFNSVAHHTIPYPYQVFVPIDIKPGEKLPLILFLHGVGEKGDDNKSQIQSNIDPLIETTQSPDSPYRAILVAPQSPSGWWKGEQVNQLVDEIESHYPIDQNREYLIGLSAGGGGCYVTIADRPKRWAAAVPIAAVNDEPSLPKIIDVPIWLIHGIEDQTVPPSHSETVFSYIKANGAKVRLTLVPDWKHGPWEPIFSDEAGFTGNYTGGDPTKNEEGLYAWLFSFVRS